MSERSERPDEMSERSERPHSMGEDDRYERGLAKYREVYGDEAVVFQPGEAAFFDLMITQLFGEVWTRPGLSVDQRRLLVMGVVAAQGRFEILQGQFARALARGELDVDQVREVIVQLVQYVGYPSSGDLFRAGETAIALHEQPLGDDEELE